MSQYNILYVFFIRQEQKEELKSVGEQIQGWLEKVFLKGLAKKKKEKSQYSEETSHPSPSTVDHPVVKQSLLQRLRRGNEEINPEAENANW